VKRLFQGLVFAVLVAFAAQVQPAAATTIDPNPTANFHIGNNFKTPTLFELFTDAYAFTLTKLATLSLNMNVFNGSTAFSLKDGANHNVSSLSNLAAGDYTLSIIVSSNGGGLDTFYGGTADFVAAAATPIPGTLLLLTTALGGLGFAGFRQRRRGAAA